MIEVDRQLELVNLDLVAGLKKHRMMQSKELHRKLVKTMLDHLPNQINIKRLPQNRATITQIRSYKKKAKKQRLRNQAAKLFLS